MENGGRTEGDQNSLTRGLIWQNPKYVYEKSIVHNPVIYGYVEIVPEWKETERIMSFRKLSLTRCGTSVYAGYVPSEEDRRREAYHTAEVTTEQT